MNQDLLGQSRSLLGSWRRTIASQLGLLPAEIFSYHVQYEEEGGNTFVRPHRHYGSLRTGSPVMESTGHVA